MIREHSDINKTFFIHRIFPIFWWEKCEYCDHDFRYERGYKITNHPYFLSNFIFICKHCAVNKKEVLKRIEELKERIRANRPKAPPPPPVPKGE